MMGFHVFVGNLAVEASIQGQGVGRRLHEAVEEAGRNLGAVGLIADPRLTVVGHCYNLGYRLPGTVFMIHDLGQRAPAQS